LGFVGRIEVMTMVRCPACATVFRASPEQLAARAGLVRCGRCSTVFNARGQFVEDAPPNKGAVAVGEKVLPEATPPAADSMPVAFPQAAPFHVGSVALPAEEGTSGDARTGATEPQDSPIPVPASLLAKESIDSALVVAGPDYPVSGQLSELADQPAHGFLHRSAIAWGTVLLLGAVLALVQIAYLFRSEIALASPTLRPTLVKWCARLDCRIELPRKADLINIDVSDLQPDADRQGHLILTATVKNRATFAQAFPFLELTLTNSRNQALARRVIRPEAYLPPEFDLNEGFPATADVSLRLVIDASGVGAMGYQLYLFYP
jgi:predicted Zn finger-like uncharacterized protein